MSVDELIAEEFRLDDDLAYLNHAAVAPWPQRACTAVRAFAYENATRGAADYPRWVHEEAELRQRIADFIHAPSVDDVALLKNTSEALSVVAQGLHWQRGDNVVISNQEFPSNRIPWEALQVQGVEVREVDLYNADTPEAALIDAMDSNTRLLSISSVQYGNGLRVNTEQLGEHCRAHGILFCVDAIQSIGALATDVQAMRADFVMADGHKWMLGPEGLAIFYCRTEVRERLTLHQYGWHMVEHAGDFDRRDWAPAASARRFECGSPNMLGIHALNASLEVLMEAGGEAVETRVLDNARNLLKRIRGSHTLELVTDDREGRYAGIVTFRHPDIPGATLYQQLRGEAGVVCAARGGGVRLSPHFYNRAEEIERAVAAAESARPSP